MTTYIPIKGRAANLANATFGNLVALGPIRKGPDGRIIWLCQCKCGSTTEVRSCHLISGHTQSCGCQGSRMTAGERFSTHSLGKSREYKSWAHIVQRCTNPNNRAFGRYGGRGITVCDEWRHSFQAFYDYVSALPNSGQRGYSIDRIDNDGNYEPGNVKWSTQTEQARNKRSNHLLTFNGKTLCVSEWANVVGISAGTLYGRLKNGWDIKEALTTPVRLTKPKGVV